MLFAIDGHFATGVLTEKDAITLLQVNFDECTVVEALAVLGRLHRAPAVAAAVRRGPARGARERLEAVRVPLHRDEPARDPGRGRCRC